jgi:hypothetical protein
MNFRFYCGQLRWLNGRTPNRPQERAMRNPQPFTVYQSTPGQNAKPIFTVHAYSIEQARAIVAAKVAGETIIIVGPVARDGASR